jgi:hypothetical protein
MSRIIKEQSECRMGGGVVTGVYAVLFIYGSDEVSARQRKFPLWAFCGECAGLPVWDRGGIRIWGFLTLN